MIAASQGANSRKGSAVSGASSTVNTNPRHPRHPHHHRNDDTTPLMRSQSPYSTVSSNSRRPSNHSDATYHLQGGSRRPSAATTVSNPSNPRPSTSETSSLLNAYAQIHHQPHQPQQPWSNQHQDTSQWSNRGTYPSLSELGYPTQPYPSIPQRDTSSRTSSSSSASSASAKTPPRPKPQMGRIASLAPTIASTDIGDDDTRSTIKSRHHGRATPPTGPKAAPAFIPPPIPEQGREWKPPQANGTGKASAAALMAKNARMRHMSLMTDGGKSLAPSTVYDEDD
ncbi:hypothetical protein BC829DRAFT_382811 [Chytridium lagenaria]|nr:hypothetical protein BC829DRAFT_382811 [Chytridium lagenaria]